MHSTKNPSILTERKHGNTNSFFTMMAVNIESNSNNESNSHVDRQSWLLQLLSWLPFVKRKKQLLSASDQWTLIRTQNKLMFQFYLLIFLFYNDDMILDDSEKRMVKKQFRKSKSYLTTQHYQKISEIGSSFVSQEDIEAYITNNKLTNDFVSEAIKEVKSMVRKRQKYHSLLDEIAIKILHF